MKTIAISGIIIKEKGVIMTYTKKDFLTAFQYAKKHNIDKKLVLAAMSLAEKRNETVKIYTTNRQIVFKKSSTYHLRPEPAAQERFMQILQEIKTKGKAK